MSAALLREMPFRYAPAATAVAVCLQGSPGFERVFRYCCRRGVWPSPDLTAPVMSPIPAFADLTVPQLPTVASLAEWLLMPPERLDYLSDRHGRFEQHGETAINHYHYVLEPKKRSGLRLLEAPKSGLKSVQRRTLRAILDQVPSHPDAFGFVKGRDCLQAAGRHVGEEVVVCLDLKDFFPSVGAGRVFGLFRCLGYPHAVARHLTALCTTSTPPRILQRLPPDQRASYRNPHLPQGAPTSPALSNHAAYTLDRRLSSFAASLGAHYSRYADDLSFSGDKHIVAALLKIVPQIVVEEGFAVNRAKTRVMSSTSRQRVTGVVVNQHLNVTREGFDNLKAVIDACGKPDDTRLTDPAFRAALLGQIEWVAAVNPRRGAKLKRLLIKAATRQAGEPP